MRAFISDRFGDVDDLHLREVARPAPGPGQLLIEVRAAALNPADLKVLRHKDGGSFLHASTFPLMMGFDFSGSIAEVGSAAGRHAVGDEVFGFLPYARSTRGGSYAEYVVADAGAVGPKPRSISHEQAAAAATAATAALQGLRDEGKLAAGQSILINGASGGVGSFAVQIAKLLGASVSATASAAKLDYVKSLGADRVYDYRTTTLAQIRERFAVVLDVASTSSFGACASLLEPAGTYVALLPSPSVFLGMGRALFSAKRCKFVVVKPLAGDLDQLRTWLDEGKLRPILDSSYPFAELPAALARMRSGDVRGKLAVTIGGA
jgi:NADPH:quinone reductase-like Zn-dependent oxidoreductase